MADDLKVIQRLHENLSDDLERISRRFIDGVKLTLICRYPGHDESDVLLSDEEDLNDAIKLIERRLDAQP